MRLGTKGRYAVTAMLDLALHIDLAPVSLADIASRQHIPLPYLGQLFVKLRQCKLVESSRGPGGGYCLAKAAEDISITDIIMAVNESIDTTRCQGRKNCHDDHRCLTHDLWEDLGNQIALFLAEINLAELVRRHCTRLSSETTKEIIYHEYR